MKPIKLLMIVTAAALITFGLGGYALAFHDGGVAHCDGCHTMHNSENGVSIIPGGTVGTAGDHLTVGATPTSTCLSCHEGSGSYHIFNDTADASLINLTPGGDFYWMKKTFTYVTHGVHTAASSNHGHNVIAPDYGLMEESQNLTGMAPGGSYPSNQLHCSSCHNPHGKKAVNTGPIEASGSYGDCDPASQSCGNYRLLGDVGYQPGGTSTGVTFTQAAPIATTYHYRDDGGQNELDDRKTAYGQGMAEWCSNCHTNFLSTSAGQHRHPASNVTTLGGQGLDDNYNAYVKTGDLTGSSTTSYLALVPFERQNNDRIALDAFSTNLQGPDPGSNVMCLTCHRAHASAFPNAGRWDFETEFPAVDSHPKDTDTGAVAGDELASYYGRDMLALFGASQRSFCNKCHIQD